MGLVIPETIESLWQFGEQAVLHLADRERQLLLTVEGICLGVIPAFLYLFATT